MRIGKWVGVDRVSPTSRVVFEVQQVGVGISVRSNESDVVTSCHTSLNAEPAEMSTEVVVAIVGNEVKRPTPYGVPAVTDPSWNWSHDGSVAGSSYVDPLMGTTT